MTDSLFHLINEKDSYDILAYMEYEEFYLFIKSKVLPFRIDYKKLTYLKFLESYDAVELLLVGDPIIKLKNSWKIIYITILTKGRYGCTYFYYKLKRYLEAPLTTIINKGDCTEYGKDLILMLSKGDKGRSYDNPITGLSETYVKLLNKNLKIMKTVISWDRFGSFDGSIEEALSTYSFFSNAEEIAKYFSQRGMLYRASNAVFTNMFRERLKRNHPKEINFLRYLLTNHLKIIDSYYLLLYCMRYEYSEFVTLLLKSNRNVKYYDILMDTIVNDGGYSEGCVRISPKIGDIIKEAIKRDCDEEESEILLRFVDNIIN